MSSFNKAYDRLTAMYADTRKVGDNPRVEYTRTQKFEGALEMYAILSELDPKLVKDALAADYVSQQRRANRS